MEAVIMSEPKITAQPAVKGSREKLRTDSNSKGKYVLLVSSIQSDGVN